MEDEIEKIMKAYGGCELCYGKGYSTTSMQYSDESAGTKWDETEMVYCKCSRGLQLEEWQSRLLNQAVLNAQLDAFNWLLNHASGGGDWRRVSELRIAKLRKDRNEHK